MTADGLADSIGYGKTYEWRRSGGSPAAAV